MRPSKPSCCTSVRMGSGLHHLITHASLGELRVTGLLPGNQSTVVLLLLPIDCWPWLSSNFNLLHPHCPMVHKQVYTCATKIFPFSARHYKKPSTDFTDLDIFHMGGARVAFFDDTGAHGNDLFWVSCAQACSTVGLCSNSKVQELSQYLTASSSRRLLANFGGAKGMSSSQQPDLLGAADEAVADQDTCQICEIAVNYIKVSSPHLGHITQPLPSQPSCLAIGVEPRRALQESRALQT